MNGIQEVNTGSAKCCNLRCYLTGLQLLATSWSMAFSRESLSCNICGSSFLFWEVQFCCLNSQHVQNFLSSFQKRTSVKQIKLVGYTTCRGWKVWGGSGQWNNLYPLKYILGSSAHKNGPSKLWPHGSLVTWSKTQKAERLLWKLVHLLKILGHICDTRSCSLVRYYL